MRGLFLKIGIILVALVLLTQLTAAVDLYIEVSPQTVTEGERIVVTVVQDGAPVENVFLQFTIDEGTPIYAVTNESGQAIFTPEIAGILKIVAMKDWSMCTCKYITVTPPASTPASTPTTPGGSGGGGDGTSYWWSSSVALPSGTFTKTAFDTGKRYTIDWWTASGALQRVSEVGGFSYEIKETAWGPFTHSIAGKKTGDEGAASGWMYQVNGEIPMVGASKYPVNVGDEIIWYFAKSMDTTPSTSSMVLRIKIVGYYSAPIDSGISPTPTPTPAPARVVEEVKKIELIEAGANTSVTFDWTNITQIIINANNTVHNAYIKIEEVPANIAAEQFNQIFLNLDGILYCHFNITTTNLTDIAGATIESKVNKTWINERNIDERTITLNRYRDINNTWTALPTSKIGEDNTSVYFESETPGFSLFAISGKERIAPPSAPPATATPSPAITPTPAPESTALPTPTAEIAMKRVIMIVVSIVLLAIVLIAFILRRR